MLLVLDLDVTSYRLGLTQVSEIISIELLQGVTSGFPISGHLDVRILVANVVEKSIPVSVLTITNASDAAKLVESSVEDVKALLLLSLVVYI